MSGLEQLELKVKCPTQSPSERSFIETLDMLDHIYPMARPKEVSDPISMKRLPHKMRGSRWLESGGPSGRGVVGGRSVLKDASGCWCYHSAGLEMEGGRCSWGSSVLVPELHLDCGVATVVVCICFCVREVEKNGEC